LLKEIVSTRGRQSSDHRLRCARAVTLIVLLISLHVRAQDPNSEAKEHYRQGTAAYNLGRYRDAAQEYERAYELTLDPALLFNVAQAYRLAGERQKAVLTYRSYLRTAPEGDRRAIAEAKLKELEAALNFDDPFAGGAGAPTPSPARATVPPPSPPAPGPRFVESAAAPASLAARTPASDSGAPSNQPIYQRWTFWAGVGGAAAAIVIVAILASGSATSPPKTDLGSMRF
jgi:tetratricopeptide (TPR) repeat protein